MRKWHIKNQKTLWKKALHTFDTRKGVELEPYITRVEEGQAYYGLFGNINLVYKVFKHDRRTCENCRHPSCSRIGQWGALSIRFYSNHSPPGVPAVKDISTGSFPAISNRIHRIDMTPTLLIHMLYRLEDLFCKWGWDHMIKTRPHIESFFEKFNIPKMPSKNHHLGHFVREEYEAWLAEKIEDRSDIINTI